MAFRDASRTALSRNVAFGSCRERNLSHHAPNSYSDELTQQNYGHYEYRTIVYDMDKKPMSKRGYCARTAPRFPQRKVTDTASAQKYQKDQTLSPLPELAKAPFGSMAQRFRSKPDTADCPGPGTYTHDTERNRKVGWPMCFGAPDWDRLPKMEQRTLKGKLLSEKDLRKQRNMVAYLSLYY